MQKQEFEERIERTVTDEQYKVIEEVYMWHPSIRNTSGKKEWNGYNSKELAEKYNLTTKQIGNILKDEPMIGQMSIFDMNNDD